MARSKYTIYVVRFASRATIGLFSMPYRNEETKLNKRSYSSRPRNHYQHRQQKVAHVKQSNKKRNAGLFPQQHNNSGGNGAHWFGKLPPHFQCMLGLALLTLVG